MAKVGWGGHILQISRLISLPGFGRRLPAARLQALNAAAGVTVAEQRWPPAIQNAAVAVVTDGDYPNVLCTLRLAPAAGALS